MNRRNLPVDKEANGAPKRKLEFSYKCMIFFLAKQSTKGCLFYKFNTDIFVRANDRRVRQGESKRCKYNNKR